MAQVAEVFLSSRMVRPPDLPPTSPAQLPTSGASPAIDPTPVAAATPDKASESDVVGDCESRELRKTYSVAWSPEGLTIVSDGIRARQLRRVADDRMRFADVAIEIQWLDCKGCRDRLAAKRGWIRRCERAIWAWRDGIGGGSAGESEVVMRAWSLPAESEERVSGRASIADDGIMTCRS